jgi:DNA recombination protein RmuC
MDIGLLFDFIIIAGIIALFFRINRISSTVSTQDMSDVSQQISLAVLQSQSKQFTDLTTSISEIGTKQQGEIALSQQKIEQRFSELQLANQRLMQELTQTLQNQTKDSLQGITESTRKELATQLSTLNETTKHALEIISKTNSEKLTSIQTDIEKKLNENLEQNLKSFESVTKNLTEMQSTAGKMIDSTQSIDKLNRIFERTSSKAFGDFGEKYLESLLEQHLYDGTWTKQVTVEGTSDRIDFVIQVGDQIIGIDSKFPVTRFQDYLNAEGDAKKPARKAYLDAIKLMAQDISNKYYKSDKIDALLLYLPSDGMFAEAVNDDQLMKQLNKLKVTLSSPATLFPLIMMIHEFQFKQQVNERAHDIISGLKVIKRNVVSFRDEFRKLGDKIRLAQQNFDSADKSLTHVHSTVERLELTSEEPVEEKLLSE